ncbi:hypothetical protein GE107_11330 [Cohnella sp. CFH 77786]|uniref:hypothetical protein n=1 Tax=Cohnella sp. CFH 77786 TaxID=2662265 RepID=UPI001C61096A|nr:hypothetical protein [Cohnella sp. CFH 77786]MBW5446652.1 hypothetical protein [Cohnella sp. CFH 77786]
MDCGYPAAAVAELAVRLEGCGAVWVIGGSTGLAMRGANLGRAPRDLDIYADEEDAARIHAMLGNCALDRPVYSATDRYRSILSHYRIAETQVELVGDFRIETGGSRYRTEVRHLLYPEGDSCESVRVPAKLVPLGHELIFNALRDRPDRCEAAGSLIRMLPERHLPILERLLERNELSEETVRTVKRYATDPELRGEAGLI